MLFLQLTGMVSKIYNHCKIEHNINNDSALNKTDGFINFGKKNDFPQTLAKAVKNSHTGRACIETRAQFIEGGGFSDEEIGSIVINDRGHTMADLNHSIAQDLAWFDGFGCHEMWMPKNGMSVGQVYYTPFENMRLGLPNETTGEIKKIVYNPKFGSVDYKKEQNKFYDVFTSNKEKIRTLFSEGKGSFRGTMSYYCVNSPNSRYYSDPNYYSGIEWFFTDAAIGRFHERNVNNNFLLSAIFKMIGNPDEDIVEKYQDANGEDQERIIEKVGDMFDRVMRETFSGTENGGKSLVLWSKDKEDFPEIEAFPTNTNDKLFDTLQEITSKNITIATQVPAILANIGFGGSMNGEGETIKQSIKMMQSRVVHYQQMMERYYMKLSEVFEPLKGRDISLTPYSPMPDVDMIPEIIWEVLSIEEKRRWISENTNIQLDEVKVEEVQDKPEEDASTEDVAN